MNKLILVIFLMVMIVFNIQTSFGYNVTYEEWGIKIKSTPSVCIFEPNVGDDQYLTEDFVKRLIKATSTAINEWEVLLKQSERTRDKSMWEISQITIPFEKQKTFNFNECNVFIHFRDKPELQEDYFKLLGKTSYEQGNSGRSEITVYYAGIDVCQTEDDKFIYYNPCYGDSPRLIQQLSSVVKHEFGHALGLGHYVSDDDQVNIDWARGITHAPSIMAVFTHQNYNENRITPLDIDKVRSIYGETGFSQNMTTKVNTFESFESTLPEYIIPKGGFQIASIDGLINKEKVISGIQVILEITDPNGKTVSTSVRVNSDGGFNSQKVIDESVSNGTYFAIASYRGEKSDQITFDVLSEGIAKNESKIPQWVKNSVRWWSEDKISNMDFVLGIRYLIKIGVLNPLPVKQMATTDSDVMDSDGDGILNKWDSCIKDPEIFNGVLDKDGCPDTINIVIPEWIKNNAKWWVDGQISDEGFISGIQYLIKMGLIKI